MRARRRRFTFGSAPEIERQPVAQYIQYRKGSRREDARLIFISDIQQKRCRMLLHSTVVVQIQYRSGTDTAVVVQTQYSRGTDTVQSWYRHSTVVVQTQYSSGTDTLQSWYRHSTVVVQTKYSSDT
eukprot:2633278-Pyramimonas_sp.AAC.1